MKPIKTFRDFSDSQSRFKCYYPSNQQRIQNLKAKINPNPSSKKEALLNKELNEQIKKWENISNEDFRNI